MPVSRDTNLNDLFTEGIRQLYWIEKHTADTLPDLREAAVCDELKSFTGEYLNGTRLHLERLNNVFALLYEKPRDMKCKSISVLLKEAGTAITGTGDGSPARDAALILQMRMIVHYQISFYGDILLFPGAAGLSEVSTLLGRTLEEEKEAKEKLSALLLSLDPAVYPHP
jgi:ferritin-like metal-binding protein YciE